MTTESMLNYCIEKAREGDSSGRVRVYSVATDKRGNFLGESLNSYIKTSPIMKRWSNKLGHIGKEYMHSEIITLLRSSKAGKMVSDLYVARVDKKGNVKDGKPCVICSAYIQQEFPELKIHWTLEKEMKIWRLECSHGGDPLYTWAFFKNKPDVQMIRNEFVDYTRCIPSTDDLEQLINKGKVMIKSDEFYLEEVEVIENDSVL